MNLAIFFIKSVIGKKTKVSLLFVVAIIFLCSLLSVQINISLPYKFSQDLTIVLESFVLHIVSFFIAFKLIGNRQLQIFMLSNGISRQKFIYATILANIIALFCIFAIFCMLNFIVFFIIQNSIYLLLSAQLFLFLLSAVLFSSIFILLALYFGYFSATVYSLVIFLSGSSLQTIKSSLNISSNFDFCFFIYPNFEFFNMLGSLTSGANFGFINLFLFASIYFILYFCALFVFAIKKFNTKIL